MKRTRIIFLLGLVVLVVTLALPAMAHASAAADGWTWDENSALSADGWTWDEAALPPASS